MKTAVCALLLAVFAVAAQAADVSGKWKGTFSPEGDAPSGTFAILKQAGTSITGSAGPDEQQQWPLTNGKLVGNKLTGDVTSPDGMVFKLDLTLDGDNLKGAVSMTHEGETMKATLDVTRVKS
jgi:opacity protein-like surface antigen